MRKIEFINTDIKEISKSLLLKSICFFLSIFIVILLFSNLERQKTINQLQAIRIEDKNRYDSLHWEFTVISNEHDRFGYSIDYIQDKYPNVVKEFYHYYENETE